MIETGARQTQERVHNWGAIKESFSLLLNGNDLTIDRASYAPLKLSDGVCQAGLIYRRLKPKVLNLQTFISKEAENDFQKIAVTDYFFADEGGLVSVSSITFVDPQHRQKGIGSGLVQLTDDVVYYALDRFPELKNSIVIGEMIDAAEGPGIIREGKRIGKLGWTGQLLARLGYTYTHLRNLDDQPIWTKTYHMPLQQIQQ